MSDYRRETTPESQHRSAVPHFGIPSYDDEPKPLTPENILAIRKKAGLSQVKFAAALGVSVKKVSAWEHGKAVPDEAEMKRIITTFKQ